MNEPDPIIPYEPADDKPAEATPAPKVDLQGYLAKVVKWLSDQKDTAKLAWTIIVGVLMFYGYNTVLTPLDTEGTPEPAPSTEQVDLTEYKVLYDPTSGDTTITIKGTVEAIDGYRVRPIE
jgi:hypothetical protein